MASEKMVVRNRARRQRTRERPFFSPLNDLLCLACALCYAAGALVLPWWFVPTAPGKLFVWACLHVVSWAYDDPTLAHSTHMVSAAVVTTAMFFVNRRLLPHLSEPGRMRAH